MGNPQTEKFFAQTLPISNARKLPKKSKILMCSTISTKDQCLSTFQPHHKISDFKIESKNTGSITQIILQSCLTRKIFKPNITSINCPIIQTIPNSLNPVMQFTLFDELDEWQLEFES
jgi:hypothetical protein